MLDEQRADDAKEISVSLNVNKRRLIVGETSIDLSAMELAVMRVLETMPGTRASSASLSATISRTGWPGFTPAQVVSTISTLRMKLGGKNLIHLLDASPGKGYMWLRGSLALASGDADADTGRTDPWTSDKIRLLQTLCKRSELTAREISGMIGGPITRWMVIEKASELGLRIPLTGEPFSVACKELKPGKSWCQWPTYSKVDGGFFHFCEKFAVPSEKVCAQHVGQKDIQ